MDDFLITRMAQNVGYLASGMAGYRLQFALRIVGEAAG